MRQENQGNKSRDKYYTQAYKWAEICDKICGL